MSLCGSPDQVPELDLLGLGGQTLPVVAGKDGDDVLVHTEVAVVSLDVLQPGVLPQYLTRRIMLYLISTSCLKCALTEVSVVEARCTARRGWQRFSKLAEV